MGGNSRGRVSSVDIKTLAERAKKRLDAVKDEPSSRHVFLSFDYDDINDINMLRGQAKNEKNQLQFDDFSVQDAYNSDNADYIKSQIRERIDRSSVTVVYLSDKCATSEWVNWEIAESLKRGKGVIGVYKGDAAPQNIPSVFRDNACKAVKWEHASIMAAIEQANLRR
jgi:hypothetical protein